MADFDNAVLERNKSKERERIASPRMYHVIMRNDSSTPMDYVVYVLAEVFGLDFDRAVITMLHIHENNEGIVGTYTRSEAYEKVDKVEAMNIEYKQDLQVDVRQANNK